MMGGGQMLKEISLDAKENFTPEQITRFEDDPEFYKRFVKGIEKDTSGNFRLVRLVQSIQYAQKVLTVSRFLGGQRRSHPSIRQRQD